MPDIIDIDTGPIIAGETSIEKMGETILERVIEVRQRPVPDQSRNLKQDDLSRGNGEFLLSRIGRRGSFGEHALIRTGENAYGVDDQIEAGCRWIS